MKTYYLHTLNGDLAVLCGTGRNAYFATNGLRKIVLAKHAYPSRRDLLRAQAELVNYAPNFYDGQRLGYLMVRA